MNKFKDWLANSVGMAGAYSVSLAEITGIMPMPLWVAIVSALAGVFLTFALAMIRIAEARIKMAEARRKEIENQKLEDENTDTDESKEKKHATRRGK